MDTDAIFPRSPPLEENLSPPVSRVCWQFYQSRGCSKVPTVAYYVFKTKIPQEAAQGVNVFRAACVTSDARKPANSASTPAAEAGCTL